MITKGYNEGAGYDDAGYEGYEGYEEAIGYDDATNNGTGYDDAKGYDAGKTFYARGGRANNNHNKEKEGGTASSVLQKTSQKSKEGKNEDTVGDVPGLG